MYGPLVEQRDREVPALEASLVCEATEGRLEVDAAWPAIAPLRDPLFYLAGPPAMLASLTSQLREHDVLPERIRIDAWE